MVSGDVYPPVEICFYHQALSREQGYEFILHHLSYDQRTKQWDVTFPTLHHWAFLGLPADSMTCHAKGKRKSRGWRLGTASVWFSTVLWLKVVMVAGPESCPKAWESESWVPLKWHVAGAWFGDPRGTPLKRVFKIVLKTNNKDFLLFNWTPCLISVSLVHPLLFIAFCCL